jgi:hypothetical protein
MKQRPPLSQWLSVCLRAAAVLSFAGAMALFAPSAEAQTCSSVNLAGTETHYYSIDPNTLQKVPNGQKNMNALALIFRAAGLDEYGNLRPISCVQEARNKLLAHLIDTRVQTGSKQWQEWLSGAYITYVFAAGMAISGRGEMTEELDLLIRDVGDDYVFVKGHPSDPCGLYATDPNGPVSGLQFSRRGNSCMDDYAVAAQGLGWKAAYWRLSTRYYQSVRSDAVSKMRNALLDSESVCVHSPSTFFIDDLYGSMYEAPICNRAASSLDTGGDEIVLSLNHGNQAPNYGFGLLTSVAAGAVAFESMNHPLTSGEFSPNELKAAKYLWREASVNTTSSGDFHSKTTNNATCLNVAGPLTGRRYLMSGWGCEDQQFGWGDPYDDSDPNNDNLSQYQPQPGEHKGYDAHWFPLSTFYDRVGFTKVTGNGYSFSTFADPYNRFNNNLDEFYGPGRLETYKTLSSVWFNSRPPLTARSEFRLSIAAYNTSGGRILVATNGGGSSVAFTGASVGVTNTNFEIVDLNGATLNTGDPVAVRVKNAGGTSYYLTAPSGGGTVTAASTSVGTDQTFTIAKVSGSNSTLISSLDYFSLRTGSSRYLEAVNGGGGNMVSGSTVYSNFARFRFNKTELPRRVY